MPGRINKISIYSTYAISNIYDKIKIFGNIRNYFHFLTNLIISDITHTGEK